jgi:class 3 adenylate cyclase
MERPETVYVRSGDIYLACQAFGEGPIAVVVIPGRVHCVELIWDDPERSAFFSGLAGFARVIVYDKRGVGCSDRNVGIPMLEHQVEDVRAVMDAHRVERALLFGTRDGAALAALCAATIPARVTGLMLWHPHVRGAWAPDYPWGDSDTAFPWSGLRFASEEHIEHGIRTQTPDKAGDPAFRRRYSRLLRVAASPSAAAAQWRMWIDTDVRDVLPSVQAPTLVMHGGVGEVAESRYVAERLPLARLVEFPDLRATAPYLADSRAPLRTMRAFIEEASANGDGVAQPTRVLATVLFTDLVGSTEQAVVLGPRWQEVLRMHNAVIRRQLAHYRGHEVDTAGDGFFASGFDGPARAIRCGCAIRDALQPLGLSVRVGVHTGECDVVDGKLAGLAVAIGARVSSAAEPGEVLVSGTVRDLVAGSGIEFEPRGNRDLRGIGEWPLFAVVSV